MSISYFLEKAKDLGLRECTYRFFRKLGFHWFTRSLIFFKCDLDMLLDADAASEPYHFKLARYVDVLNDHHYFDGWFKQSKALQRLKDGCFLVFSEKANKRVYFHWSEVKNVDLPWFDLRFPISDKVVYRTCIYTVPEFQGQGIASLIGLECLYYWKRKGYKHVFVVIDPKNTASIHLHKKLGFYEYQVAFYRRFLFLRQYRVKQSGTENEWTWWGIFNGPQALWKTFWVVIFVVYLVHSPC